MKHPGDTGGPSSLKQAAYQALSTAERRAHIDGELYMGAAVTYALLDIAREMSEANRIAKARR